MSELTDLEHIPEKRSDGMVMKFTTRGMGYLAREDGSEDSGEDREAMDEHVREKLKFGMSLSEVQRRWGIGTRLYFSFLKFLICANAILAFFTMLHWLPFFFSSDGDRFVYSSFPSLPEDPDNYSQRRLTFGESIFISAYPSSRRGMWVGMNIIAVICWFSFGPIFAIIARRISRKTQADDHDNPFAFSGMQLDKIPGNDHITAYQRIKFRIISYTVFSTLIFISGFIIYGLQTWKNGATQDTDENSGTFQPINFLVTFTVSFLNFFWKYVCGFLTNFERHKTWAEFRKHHVMKLYLFKVINVSVLYFSTRFAFVSDKDACPLQDTGKKFLSLIISDLFVFNVIEILMPKIKIFLSHHVKKMRSKGGDESEKPEFDVAEELLELFYRMFVLYLGMLVFPPITLLTLLTNIIEYPLDKWRMLRVCQRPKRLDLSMRHFLVIFMVITAFLALISFPNGVVFILAGQPSDALDKCTIFNQNLEINP